MRTVDDGQDYWIAFLNARLGEDEHYLQTMIEASERYAALATAKDTADAYSMAMAVADDPQVRKLLMKAMEGVFRPPNDLHQALREVQAKRAILAGYLKADDDLEDPWVTNALLTALGHHMAVWDDHLDYPAARKSLEEAYWTP